MKTTGSKPAKPQVLVVDDDITIRGLLTETLVDRGYEVCVAPRVEDALNRIHDALVTAEESCGA